MNDPAMSLLCSALESVASELAGDPASDGAWASAHEALDHYGISAEDDAELAAAVESRDASTLAEIVSQWAAGERMMLEHDRGVLKRALKAYRKRLKVTLLDAESSVAGGPMSAGRESNIVGIEPPERYPREVWDELVRQKRLVDRGRGTYELAAGV